MKVSDYDKFVDHLGLDKVLKKFQIRFSPIITTDSNVFVANLEDNNTVLVLQTKKALTVLLSVAGDAQGVLGVQTYFNEWINYLSYGIDRDGSDMLLIRYKDGYSITLKSNVLDGQYGIYSDQISTDLRELYLLLI